MKKKIWFTPELIGLDNKSTETGIFIATEGALLGVGPSGTLLLGLS